MLSLPLLQCAVGELSMSPSYAHFCRGLAPAFVVAAACAGAVALALLAAAASGLDHACNILPEGIRFLLPPLFVLAFVFGIKTQGSKSGEGGERSESGLRSGDSRRMGLHGHTPCLPALCSCIGNT
jgi:hypothetical protein